MKTVRMIARGKVQGVNYRTFISKAAGRLGITGSVRNLENGCVEIVASGTEDALEQFEKAAAGGPPLSTVEEVGVEEILFTPFNSFSILR